MSKYWSSNTNITLTPIVVNSIAAYLCIFVNLLKRDLIEITSRNIPNTHG